MRCAPLNEENYAPNMRQRFGDTWDAQRRPAPLCDHRLQVLNTNLRRRSDPGADENLNGPAMRELILRRPWNCKVDAGTRHALT